MLDAGVDLLGSGDRSALSVRTVCRSTGITERYFYEAFGTRDAFARAVFDDVTDRAREALVGAVRETTDATDPAEIAAAAVAAFVELVIDNPRAGRVLLLAPYREAALSERGLSRLPDFFAVVAAALPGDVGENTRRLVAVGLVGALTAIFTEYLSGRLDVARAELVAHCVRLVATAPVRFSDAE
nr:TetR/AcrR family transcriptional regulator [Tsukamurella sp. PLM1]